MDDGVVVVREHNYSFPKYNQETGNIEQICSDCGLVKVLDEKEQMEFLKMLLEERNNQEKEEDSLKI